MNSLDRCRRATSVALVVASLILVPGAAVAKFTAAKTPAALGVATATMAVPTAVHGNFVCSSQGNAEGISISITSFTDTGPSGSTYTYTLLFQGAVTTSTTSALHATMLTASVPNDRNASTWSMTIWARLANWTGPVSTTEVSCSKQSNDTGIF